MDNHSTIPTNLPYASFWKRFHAYGYDSLLVMILGWVVNGVLGGIAHAQTPEEIQTLINAGLLPEGTVAEAVPMLLTQSIGSLFHWSDFVVPLLISAIYNVYFVAGEWQATPGKRFCGIHVVNADGSRLTLQQSALRYCARGVSSILLGLPFLTICFTREKLAPHDMMCQTRVLLGKTNQQSAATQGISAMPAPLTPEDILADLRTAQFITSLRCAPTSPKFVAMLANPSFASQAYGIVSKKIADIQAGVYRFADGSAHTKTLRGWERTLAKIEESLAHGGTKSR